MAEIAATATTIEAPRRGSAADFKNILKKVFGKRAPWWVKALRTATLIAATLFTADRALLPHVPGRSLTSGEETMLREVFQDSVDYDKMRIHQSAASDFLLNLTGITATTRGNVIFIENTPEHADYAAQGAEFYMQYTLVHETGHIWQRQNGVMPGLFNIAALNISRLVPGGDKHADYHYDVTEGKDLLEYNIEQQASILTESFFLSKQDMDPLFEQSGPIDREALKAGFEQTLRNFNANPAYPNQTPKSGR